MDVELFKEINQHLVDIKYILNVTNFILISFYIILIFRLIYKFLSGFFNW